MNEDGAGFPDQEFASGSERVDPLASLLAAGSQATRITLVCRGEAAASRDWDEVPAAGARLIITTESDMSAIVAVCLEERLIEVERIIIDRAMDGERFLQFLCDLPAEYQGDVLCTKEDGSGFLSASARVTGRSMYHLSPSDVRFYLEIGGLVPRAGEGTRPAS